MPVQSFAEKIGMFPTMKSNNVALQLSAKCMAETGKLKGKIQFWADLELHRIKRGNLRLEMRPGGVD
jgi:hypothetical protein